MTSKYVTWSTVAGMLVSSFAIWYATFAYLEENPNTTLYRLRFSTVSGLRKPFSVIPRLRMS